MGNQRFIALLVFLSCGCATARALTTNAWISPTSGNWEDASNWSLGIPPASDQDILLTNSGWKAVAINPSTAQNYPQTMNVNSIMVGSPTNTMNELLLNYFGFQTPLAVHGLYIQSNSTVVALDSALQVTATSGPNGFSVGGTFVQAQSAQVSAVTMIVGDLGLGVYYLTNGTLSVATEAVGGAFGGTFNQFGGTHSAGDLRVQSGSQYNLYDGDFTGGITLSDGAFLQQGGTVNATALTLVRGTYTLSSGFLNTAGMAVPGIEAPTNGPSSFLQTGGTNTSSAPFEIGTVVPSFGLAPGDFTLSNGVVTVPGMTVGPFGSYTQQGGSCTVDGTIVVTGANIALNSYAWGDGYLGAGTLSSTGIDVSIGGFSQTGGTNIVQGDLNVGPSPVDAGYSLSGGFLGTSNTTVRQDNLFGRSFNGGFLQGGGTLQVANLLRVSGNTKGFFGFVLAGTVSAQNLEVDTGGTLDQRAGSSLAVPGLVTFAQGTWLCTTGQQQVGQLMLGVADTPRSTLSLPAGPAVVRFADSSSVVWSNSATLTIQNWTGSPNGGGNQQIFFGTSSSGLTPQQLTQLQFRNPDGVPGLFPAMILPTGEIVPDQFLSVRLNAAQLMLQWATGFVLQSATNVTGAYQDVSGAASPYTVGTASPSRFFRLRRQQ
jgi:hypothetical protein